MILRSLQIDHVVVRKNCQELACLHCGQSQAVAMPCPVPVFVGLVDAWERLRRNCPAPAPEDLPPEGGADA